MPPFELLSNSGVFHALADSAADAIVCFDSHQKIVFWNAAAERTFGHARADALGKSLSLIIPDEILNSGTWPFLDGVVTVPARGRNGLDLQIDLSLSLWHDGETRFFTAIMRDVSERVALQDLLVMSEQDYRRLFEYAHDAILILDPDTEIVLEANRRAGDLYGIDYQELVGRSIEELSVDPAEGKKRLAETLSADGKYFFSTVQKKNDGTRIELEIGAAVVHYHGSDAVLSINRDVTARNATQRALARERDFVSQVLDVAGSLVIVLDLHGRILRFNQACERASGYSAAEVLGRPFWEVVLPETDSADTRREFERLCAGELASAFENVWQRRDGALRQISWANTALLDVHGAPEFIVGTGIDVTEARETEEQLAKTQRLAGLGEVAASVAHEFNNVLMGISPFVTVLQKHATGDATSAAATHIGRAVARGKAVAGAILRYAQPAQPTREHIDVHSYLTEVSHDLAPQVGNGIVLSIDAPPGISILADPVQLHQVMSNLVLNARDAMPAGGRIAIDVRRGATGAPEFGVVRDPSRFAHFRVCDEGTGMSRHTLDRLFEPLFTTKKSGTGLGLAVTYQIVRLHDGHIFAVSEPGRGTTFHLYLPLVLSSERGEARE